MILTFFNNVIILIKNGTNQSIMFNFSRVINHCLIGETFATVCFEVSCCVKYKRLLIVHIVRAKIGCNANNFFYPIV